MKPRTDSAVEEILERGHRRGFLTVAEIQRDLELPEVSGSAFERVVDRARAAGIEVREDGLDDGTAPLLGDDIVAVSDPLRMYFREIRRVPLLTAQEEVELAMAMEAAREAEARLERDDREPSLGPDRRSMLLRAVRRGERAEQRLVESNLRLVVSIAKRYVGVGMPLLDLIQEGNLGLMKAVERFDYRRGNKFSTYATWWIRQGVSRALAVQSRTIRVPVHMVEIIYKLTKARRRLFQELGREPTVEDIAREIDLSPGRVLEISRISERTLSLEAPVNDTDESTLGDFVPDRGARAPVEETAFQLLQEYVARALEGLTDRERQAILLRFGLVDGRPRTLTEVGAHLSVTRERIRQLEIRALYKLRRNTGSRRLEGYLRDS